MPAFPEHYGRAQIVWLDRVEREHDNLRAALRFFVQVEDARRGMRLAAALRRFWWVRGHIDEAGTWFTTLAQAEALMRSARAFFYETLEDAWQAACEGESPSPQQSALSQLARTHAVQACAEAVDLMYAAAGSTALTPPIASRVAFAIFMR